MTMELGGVASLAALRKTAQLRVTDPNGAVIVVGDGQARFTIPSDWNLNNLVAVAASLTTVGSTLTTVQVRNVTDAVDMLSTAITIDATETTSYTAATPPVINTATDDVATGDSIAIDIDGAGTGAKGLAVILTFQAP